jgi:predicted CopG family antitoxin
MKNITVTVPDEIYLFARVHAAKEGTSVSALVRRFLESLEERAFPDPVLWSGDQDDEQDFSEGTPSPLFPVEL